ncbi:MAG TPA: helix-turn-helix domain-containing protein, partial [Niastella sp.]|nr:helix-turn-helix domain-containing protein [Niastella sp.]
CPELADYIEFFSETSLEATGNHVRSDNFTVKLFPSYTPTIWINLGSPYYLKNGTNTHLVTAGTDILLLRKETVERNNLPTDNIFTLKFHPGGFEAVLGISQALLGNDIMNATEVIPATVIKKMKKQDGFEDRMQLLQNWLLEKWNSQQKNNHYLKHIQATIDAFSLSGMESKNNELSRQLCMTDKTLYRYFTKVVGTSPKQYLSIVRARTALTAWITDTAAFSPYDHGYYDMSHFYRDVVRFTGKKLTAHRL